MNTIRQDIHRHIEAVEAIDSHSHMGSTIGLDFANRTSLRKVGAPSKSTGVFELLTCPYSYWGQPRFNLNTIELHERAETDVVGAFRELEPQLRRWQTQGHWQAMHLALEDLYGLEGPITAENIEALDARIRKSYADKGYYERGQEILQKAGIVSSLKMIEAPWVQEVLAGRGEEKDALVERGMICPTFLIDAAVHAPDRTVTPDRLAHLCEAMDICLQAPDDYRKLIADLFILMDEYNAKDPFGGLAGLKSATAYENDLGFYRQEASDFDAWMTRWKPEIGKALPADCDSFKPKQYLMRQVLEHANERGMAIQMHGGITSPTICSPNRLAESGCLEDFPNVNFVLLHVYPHVDDHAVLGRFTDNFYSDLSWLGLLSGSLLEDALTRLIGFSQTEKIIIGHDATCFEETYGSAIMSRRALENALVRKVESGYMGLSDAIDCVYLILRNNAIDAWKLPLEKQFAS